MEAEAEITCESGYSKRIEAEAEAGANKNSIGPGPEESEKKMKKLMFAATALLCGAVLADGEIASANIVGYAGSALDEEGGFVAIAPQFITVDQEGIKLKDIKPSTDTSTAIRRKIRIQLLDSSGGAATVYRWEGQDGLTWIPESGKTDLGETVITNGVGMWVLNSANCQVNFQTAGEVSKSDIVQELDEDGGFVMVGNSFPVSVKLKNIIPTTETSTALRRKIRIQLLDSSGGAATVYRWEGQDGLTWIPETGKTDMGETEIPAGTAVWVLNSANCQASFRICAPTTNL